MSLLDRLLTSEHLENVSDPEVGGVTVKIERVL